MSQQRQGRTLGSRTAYLDFVDLKRELSKGNFSGTNYGEVGVTASRQTAVTRWAASRWAASRWAATRWAATRYKTFTHKKAPIKGLKKMERETGGAASR